MKKLTLRLSAIACAGLGVSLMALPSFAIWGECTEDTSPDDVFSGGELLGEYGHRFSSAKTSPNCDYTVAPLTGTDPETGEPYADGTLKYVATGGSCTQKLTPVGYSCKPPGDPYSTSTCTDLPDESIPAWRAEGTCTLNWSVPEGTAGQTPPGFTLQDPEKVVKPGQTVPTVEAGCKTSKPFPSSSEYVLVSSCKSP